MITNSNNGAMASGSSVLKAWKQSQQVREQEQALFGDSVDQTESIYGLLYQLAEPQSQRDSIEVSKNLFHDLTPISKYGCVQVNYETLDENRCIFRETFRMDDELCDDVEMPHGSEFRVVSKWGIGGVGGFNELYIPNFPKSLPELDRIRRHLETVVPIYLLRGRHADFSSEKAAADGE